jgi:hypothetical protein
MKTRAVLVSMERSRTGGYWTLAVGNRRNRGFMPGSHALAWVRAHLEEEGATEAERARVLRLLASEIGRVHLAEVVAEVQVIRNLAPVVPPGWRALVASAAAEQEGWRRDDARATSPVVGVGSTGVPLRLVDLVRPARR